MRVTSLVACLCACVALCHAADYEETERLGNKKPKDVVSATVNPPGKVLTGKIDSKGGWPWTGFPQTFYATVPPNYAGAHKGQFSGTYQGKGKGKGKAKGPKGTATPLEWEMDVLADVSRRNLKVSHLLPASIEPGGEFPTNVKISFIASVNPGRADDIGWYVAEGDPKVGLNMAHTTKFPGSGTKDVRVKYIPTGETASTTVKVIDASCKITESHPFFGGKGIVTETIAGVTWHFKGKSKGFWASATEPISFKWIFESNGKIHTNVEWDFGEQEDDLDLYKTAITGGKVFDADTIYLKVTDHYGHSAEDSITLTIYPEYMVERTNEETKGQYTAWERTASVFGTNGENPQEVNFQYGQDETVTRSYSLTGGVEVEIEVVKASFGATVGEDISAGTSYGAGTKINIDGNTEGAVCWRRRLYKKQKGNIIERDKHGKKTDVGDVWVDNHTWEATMTKWPKNDLANAKPPK